jgi:hypothetical protein
MNEPRTVSRGVLWLVICVGGFIILALTSVASATVSNWALMVDKRGLENQARITVLEAKFSSIETKLDLVVKSLDENKALLMQHMDRSR